MKYYNYVMMMSDFRIKIGITGNPAKRKTYYQQEADRHGLGKIDWWHDADGVPDKQTALLVEREICQRLARIAVGNHREWFYLKGGTWNKIRLYGAIMSSTCWRCIGIRLDLREKDFADYQRQRKVQREALS